MAKQARPTGRSPPPTAAPPELRRAVRLHEAGDLAAAAAAYRRVLSQEPSNPDALHLLGTLMAGQGDRDGGTALIRRALDGKPVFPEALSNLGTIHLRAGDAAAAAGCYAEAIGQAAGDAQLHHHHAVALEALGRLDDALAAARRATALRPGAAHSWQLVGKLLDALGQPDGAEQAFRRACALAPEASDVRTSLGHFLFKTGRKAEAEAALRRAVHADPGSAHALYNLGAVLRSRGDPAGAEPILRRALAIDPRHAEAWDALGACLRSLGRFGDAAASFREALALRPGFASAWRHLTLSGRRVAGNDELAALEALARRDLPREDAASVHFAIAKLLDEGDRPDAAFAHYKAGNALIAAAFRGTPAAYDPPAFEAMVATLLAERPWENARPTNGSQLPVLIAGMPRSGTSLVEQVLASHPAVFGAGELPDLRRCAASPDLAAAGAAYAAALHSRSGGAARVTDKMPDNIFELGRLAAMLPSARVILCRRDPRDTGLSCFTTHFAAGNAYAYDLAHCGHRIRHTEALADHWRRTLPIQLLTMDYEELVGDFEAQARRMVEFLGLPWAPECLDFHRLSRPVTTASAWQVRQPLFRDSVGRWQRFAAHLGPLLDAL